MDIKSSTTARDSKNTFKLGSNLFFNTINTPTAKAISVDIGIPIPLENLVL